MPVAERLVLIDGRMLARLMVDTTSLKIGRATSSKRIDEVFFEEAG
jgi:restriction endonuclease Mrr